MSLVRARARRTGVRLITRVDATPVLGPLTRPITSRLLQRMFDGMSGDWDAIRRHPRYASGFVEALDRLPAQTQPGRVLDVACGTGLASRVVLERWNRARLDGIDIAPRMVELASERVPDGSFRVASVHELPYDDHEFDLVVSLDGMVDAREMLRVLAPDGHVVVVYSNGGTTPIARPLEELAHAFARVGGTSVAHVDGDAHALITTHA